MKASEIRDLTQEERLRKLKESKEELFNLKFQKGAGQLESSSRLKEVKRDIAKINTIIREYEFKKE